MNSGIKASAAEGGNLKLEILVSAVGAGLLVVEHMETPFDLIFTRVGKQEGADPDLLRAIARKESRFNPAAISPPNANGSRDYGIMQMNDITARALGIDPRSLITSASSPNLTTVEFAVRSSARLIRRLWSELREKANIYTLIAAYNAGSPAIRQRGIFNTSYVFEVFYHQQLYTLASLLRGRL